MLHDSNVVVRRRSVPIGFGFRIWLALTAQYGFWRRISQRTVGMSIEVILLLTELSAFGRQEPGPDARLLAASCKRRDGPSYKFVNAKIKLRG